MSVFKMPKELCYLSVCNLCMWFCMCTILIYYTDVIGQVVFEGKIESDEESEAFLDYQEGFRIGCFGLVGYSAAMAIVTLLIEKFDFYSCIRAKYLYAAQFLILSLICCLFYFFSTRTLLLGCTGIFGMAFAILECVPFMLLGRYHKSQKFVNKSPKNTKRSYGLDSSILIAQNYLGQLMMSLIIGPLVATTGELTSIFLAASLVSLVGAFFAFWLVAEEIAE